MYSVEQSTKITKWGTEVEKKKRSFKKIVEHSESIIGTSTETLKEIKAVQESSNNRDLAGETRTQRIIDNYQDVVQMRIMACKPIL